ncbi:MAG TPA: hypothetical protein VFU46_06885 [Gemmatimonadales bacterium]|nr:hypothetical protein [Gemmatimonadales bacterium]
MMGPVRPLVTVALALVLACRGEPPPRPPGDAALARMVDSLKPAVERAAGLPFRSTPRSAMRSRAQVRQYLIRKLRDELPPARLAGIQSAYRLFGLLPDTLELESLLLELYTEQVAGYYDPDSAMLFGVAGAEPLQLKLVLAHEMVHALQGQYLPLDSILRDVRNNDRLAAAQAVLEGQATLVSIAVLSPGLDVVGQSEFWAQYREQIAAQQGAMPVFARAPLVLRRTLLFPYVDGAEFMRWWESSPFADSVPWGPRLPASTEQVLHPARYQAGDGPVELRFVSGPAPMYDDALGELETRILEAELTGGSAASVVPIGWGGDRYRVYDTPAGAALVWYAVWDEPRHADRFVERVGARFTARRRPGYRATAERLEVEGRPATRLVLAPADWGAWRNLPRVAVGAH